MYIFSNVAEKIDELVTQKIPQLVWAESASFIVPVYSPSLVSQSPYEIHLPVNTSLVLFPGLLQYQHSITTVPGVRRRKCRHRRCRRSSGRQSSGFRAEACAGPSSQNKAGAAVVAAAVGGAGGYGYAGGQRQAREATAEDSRRADAVESWRTPREDKHLLVL